MAGVVPANTTNARKIDNNSNLLGSRAGRARSNDGGMPGRSTVTSTRTRAQWTRQVSGWPRDPGRRVSSGTLPKPFTRMTAALFSVAVVGVLGIDGGDEGRCLRHDELLSTANLCTLRLRTISLMRRLWVHGHQTHHEKAAMASHAVPGIVCFAGPANRTRTSGLPRVVQGPCGLHQR